METVKKFTPFVNWTLAGNPYNWAIVILMVAVGGLALALIFPQHPTTSKEDQT